MRAAVAAPWHPGRCAELLVGEAVVGHAGELHPKVCRAFGVPARTSVAELDLDALLDRAVSVPAAPDLSTYPVAKEDVALVVAADLPAEELAATLREGAGPLCESVRLFDVYTGPQVGEGHRSLAFALRFRAPDRTLTEKETAAARESAVALAAQRHGAQQRQCPPRRLHAPPTTHAGCVPRRRASPAAPPHRSARSRAIRSSRRVPRTGPGTRHQGDRAVRAAGSRARQGRTEPFASVLAQRRDVPGRRALATEER